jgi:hypothetical protein
MESYDINPIENKFSEKLRIDTGDSLKLNKTSWKYNRLLIILIVHKTKVIHDLCAQNVQKTCNLNIYQVARGKRGG